MLVRKLKGRIKKKNTTIYGQMGQSSGPKSERGASEGSLFRFLFFRSFCFWTKHQIRSFGQSAFLLFDQFSSAFFTFGLLKFGLRFRISQPNPFYITNYIRLLVQAVLLFAPCSLRSIRIYFQAIVFHLDYNWAIGVREKVPQYLVFINIRLF